MFDFRKIRLSDREEVVKRLSISDFRGCEYSFANNFAWHRLNDSVVCIHGDFYILMGFDSGVPYVIFPVGVRKDDDGKKRIIALFDELEEHFASMGHKLMICSVSEEDIPWLKDVYGDRVSFEYDRGNSDYIYKAQDLIEFAGKRFHGKRNHVKRFMDNNWSFEAMTSDSIDECVLFAAEFYNSSEDESRSAAIEQFAIHNFLMNFDELELKGGILRVDGKIVGMTIGEQLNSDTFVVHIEKARSDINGAYPMLCQQFARLNAADLMYINREEDMGIEGLRKSKMSYHPEFLLNKYVAIFK